MTFNWEKTHTEKTFTRTLATTSKEPKRVSSV